MPHALPASGSSKRRTTPPERTSVAEFITAVIDSHDCQLHRFLRPMLGKEAAMEVAQDTYTKLFRLCRPAEVRCPHALLFDVATKRAVEYLQAKERLKARLSDVELTEIADHGPDLERQAALHWAMQRLEHIISEMRPKYRSVFVLRFVHEMSHREVAERLNISADAAQQRAAAALAECRSKFSELGIDPLALA